MGNKKETITKIYMLQINIIESYSNLAVPLRRKEQKKSILELGWFDLDGMEM